MVKSIVVNPNNNEHTDKTINAVINTLIAKIEDHEKRIKILEATSNDIKPGITSDQFLSIPL